MGYSVRRFGVGFFFAAWKIMRRDYGSQRIMSKRMFEQVAKD